MYLSCLKGSYLFHDQLITKFVTKLVGTGLVTTPVIKVYDQVIQSNLVITNTLGEKLELS
ncbi:hypothetical protein BpHYR1_031676 [Brachionus plicatilis]|uniref:Uncharacterized protein n=1 Tax=Brachionus plicatilis TaxID=10195 RepID=A0A3M7P7S8_BRAPC|nr:hypothetical protein BpHYR1_031676 [Brachionus plicatilis]